MEFKREFKTANEHVTIDISDENHRQRATCSFWLAFTDKDRQKKTAHITCNYDGYDAVAQTCDVRCTMLLYDEHRERFLDGIANVLCKDITHRTADDVLQQLLTEMRKRDENDNKEEI